MSDIVERLLTPQGGWLDPLRKEAAAEIERLTRLLHAARTENKRLQGLHKQEQTTTDD